MWIHARHRAVDVRLAAAKAADTLRVSPLLLIFWANVEAEQIGACHRPTLLMVVLELHSGEFVAVAETVRSM